MFAIVNLLLFDTLLDTMECWIISAPGDKTPQQAFEKLNKATSGHGSTLLSRNYKFPIPDLKVGTLDSLIGLSDDLGKIDMFAEGYSIKLFYFCAILLDLVIKKSSLLGLIHVNLWYFKHCY